jgi:hypothetical protein
MASLAPDTVTWPKTVLLKGNAIQAVEKVTQTLLNMERQIKWTP